MNSFIEYLENNTSCLNNDVCFTKADIDYLRSMDTINEKFSKYKEKILCLRPEFNYSERNNMKQKFIHLNQDILNDIDKLNKVRTFI